MQKRGVIFELIELFCNIHAGVMTVFVDLSPPARGEVSFSGIYQEYFGIRQAVCKLTI